MSDGAVDAPKGVSGLGIAALVLGLMSVVVAIFMPCLGIFFAVPVGGIGALLGLIGIATAGKKTGTGIPIAGTVISLASIGIAVWWWYAAFATGAAAIAKEKDDALKGANSGISVTADELVKAYKDDEKKANEKYKGKWVRVKGKVDSKLLLLLTLAPSDSKAEGRVDFTMVVADTEKVAKLSPAAEITVGGKVEGETGKNVKLSSGVIID
jgi:hypothetical protein